MIVVKLSSNCRQCTNRFSTLAGPTNARREGGELFYMRKGDMELKIMEAGKFRDVEIKEGQLTTSKPRSQ